MRKLALAIVVFVTLRAHPQEQAQQQTPQATAPQQKTTTAAAQQQPQLEPVVRWTAPPQRDLPEDGKVALPVELEDDKATLAVREITRGGKQLDRSIVSAAFAQDGPQHLLNVTLDPAKTTDAGVYTVQLRVAPTNPKAFDPSSITLALTRPAAKLEVLSPIRIERTVRWPRPAKYEPSQIAIHEAGESEATIHPRTWTVNALSAERTPHVLTLREVTAKDQPATNKVTRGGGLLIAPQDGDLPLGIVTGTMSVDSPQLAAPVPVTLEVRSRLSCGYLVFIIAFGVFMGWLLRIHLERKRAVAAAQAAGVPLWEQLLELQRTTHEASLQRELATIITPLYGAWNGKSAEAIAKAVSDARTALEALQKKIAEKKKVVADQVNALRAAIGGPERQSGSLRVYVREVSKDIQRIEDDLKAGRLERATSRAETLNGELASRLNGPLTSWRRNVEDLRTSLSRWKEVKPPEIPDIGPLADQTAVAVTTKMSEAAATTATLAAFTESVERSAEGRANQTAAGASEADALQLRNGVAEVRKAREKFFEEPAAVIVPLDALRTLIERLAPAAEELRGLDAEELEVVTVPVPHVPYVQVHVNAPKVAIVGQPLRFHAEVTIDGEPVTDTTLAWSVDGQHAYLGRPRELTFSHTPLSTAPFRVRAQVVGAGQQNAQSPDVVVTATAAHRFDLIALEATRDRAETAQTWLAAIPIVFAGAVIFDKTWIGTAQDWLTAFLWGFSNDIGVNKLIDLAKPLSKLTFTPPAAASGAAKAAGGAPTGDEEEQEAEQKEDEKKKPTPPKTDPAKPAEPKKEPAKPTEPAEPTEPVEPKKEPAKPST